MPYDFRTPETAADYESAVALRNAVWSHVPISPEELRERRVYDREDRFLQRVVATRDDVDVAYGSVSEGRNREEGAFTIMICPADVEAFAATYAHLEGQAIERGAKVLRGFTASTQEAEVAWRLAKGYAVVQRNPVACLDVARADDRSDELRAAVEAQGLRLASLDQLAAEDPDGWRRSAWRLIMDLFQDVPMPFPFEEVPYELFIVKFDRPSFSSETFWVVLDGDRWVATTSFIQNRIDPRIADTHLTGCRREYRRRGLATALKHVALREARERRVERMYTDNEEGNPMRRINDALGFRREFDLLILQRKL